MGVDMRLEPGDLQSSNLPIRRPRLRTAVSRQRCRCMPRTATRRSCTKPQTLYGTGCAHEGQHPKCSVSCGGPNKSLSGTAACFSSSFFFFFFIFLLLHLSSFLFSSSSPSSSSPSYPARLEKDAPHPSTKRRGSGDLTRGVRAEDATHGCRLATTTAE
jgi:hypothetical protein